MSKGHEKQLKLNKNDNKLLKMKQQFQKTTKYMKLYENMSKK